MASKRKRRIVKKIILCFFAVLIALILGFVIYMLSKYIRISKNIHSDITKSAVDVSEEEDPLHGIGGGDVVISDTTRSADEPVPTLPTVPESIDIPATNPEPSLPNDTLSGMDGYLTIAAFGIDGGKNYRYNGYEIMDYMCSDVCMLICVNLETYEVKLVSVYRDYYLNFRETDAAHPNVYNNYDKLTNLFTRYSHYNDDSALAGCLYTTQILNQNLDLNIENYIAVDWNVIADVVDMMGGLDVPISQMEADHLNGFITETMQVVGRESYTLEGTYSKDVPTHLDGIQTVCYCRIRSVGNSDYARTERQRNVISLILEKAKTLKWDTVMDIVDVATKQIATNVDDTTILSLATHMIRKPKFTITEMTGFPFETSWTNFEEGYVYARDLISNLTRLHQYLYGNNSYTPSAKVREIQDYISGEVANNPQF